MTVVSLPVLGPQPVQGPRSPGRASAAAAAAGEEFASLAQMFGREAADLQQERALAAEIEAGRAQSRLAIDLAAEQQRIVAAAPPDGRGVADAYAAAAARLTQASMASLSPEARLRAALSYPRLVEQTAIAGLGVERQLLRGHAAGEAERLVADLELRARAGQDLEGLLERGRAAVRALGPQLGPEGVQRLTLETERRLTTASLLGQAERQPEQLIERLDQSLVPSGAVDGATADRLRARADQELRRREAEAARSAAERSRELTADAQNRQARAREGLEGQLYTEAEMADLRQSLGPLRAEQQQLAIQAAGTEGRILRGFALRPADELRREVGALAPAPDAADFAARRELQTKVGGAIERAIADRAADPAAFFARTDGATQALLEAGDLPAAARRIEALAADAGLAAPRRLLPEGVAKDLAQRLNTASANDVAGELAAAAARFGDQWPVVLAQLTDKSAAGGGLDGRLEVLAFIDPRRTAQVAAALSAAPDLAKTLTSEQRTDLKAEIGADQDLRRFLVAQAGALGVGRDASRLAHWADAVEALAQADVARGRTAADAVKAAVRTIVTDTYHVDPDQPALVVPRSIGGRPLDAEALADAARGLLDRVEAFRPMRDDVPPPGADVPGLPRIQVFKVLPEFKNNQGFKYNNPGNIKHFSSNKWAGMTDEQPPSGGGSVRFKTPEDGIAAFVKNLQSYPRRFGADTIETIINKWAPPSENATGRYVEFMVNYTGIPKDRKLDLSDAATLLTLMTAMTRIEIAGQPYDQATWLRGLAKAGVALPEAATPAELERRELRDAGAIAADRRNLRVVTTPDGAGAYVARLNDRGALVPLRNARGERLEIRYLDLADATQPVVGPPPADPLTAAGAPVDPRRARAAAADAPPPSLDDVLDQTLVAP